MLFVLFTRRHVISVSNVTLHSRALYGAQRSSAPMHAHTHTNVRAHTIEPTPTSICKY